MESKVFGISIVGTVAMATLAIVFFFLTGSNAVLLDGVFTLIGVPMAVASLIVTRVSDEAPTEDYPFGLRQARPMLELFKALFLLGLVTVAAFDAVETMLGGGRALAGESIVLYAAIAMGGCFFFAAVIAVVGRGSESTLVRLELTQWVQDGFLSGAIGLAFAISTWVDHPIVGTIRPYIDQGMVVLLAVVFFPVYARTVVSSGRQLLLGAPPKRIRDEIRDRLGEMLAVHGFGDHSLAVAHIGGANLIDVEIGLDGSMPAGGDVAVLKRELTAEVTRHRARDVLWLSFVPATTHNRRGPKTPVA